jgi:MFS superfamily sulfate permease-like transporter
VAQVAVGVGVVVVVVAAVAVAVGVVVAVAVGVVVGVAVAVVVAVAVAVVAGKRGGMMEPLNWQDFETPEQRRTRLSYEKKTLHSEAKSDVQVLRRRIFGQDKTCKVLLSGALSILARKS